MAPSCPTPIPSLRAAGKDFQLLGVEQTSLFVPTNTMARGDFRLPSKLPLQALPICAGSCDNTSGGPSLLDVCWGQFVRPLTGDKGGKGGTVFVPLPGSLPQGCP